MPRNSNGDYSLPAGNPVVTGTTISSTWANTTLADLANAMTDSLSRSGDGSMLAPLLLDDGAIGAPALSWGNETTSGLYRAGAGDFRWSISGVDKIQITSTVFRTVDGALATPGISFIADPDTGLWRSAANIMAASVGGSLAMTWDLTNNRVVAPLVNMVVGSTTTAPLAAANRSTIFVDGITDAAVQLGVGSVGSGYIYASATLMQLFAATSRELRLYSGGSQAIAISPTTQQVQFNDGAVGAPIISFSSDPDTGMYRVTADALGWATAGTQRLGLTTTTFVSTVPFLVPDGSAGTPSIAFASDTNTGTYRVGADAIGFSAGGVASQFITTQGVSLALNGSVGSPSLYFTNDSNTGVYLPVAGSLGLVADGTEFLRGSDTALDLGPGSPGVIGFFCLTSATANAGGIAIPTAAGFLAVNINGVSRKIPFCAN